MDNNRGSGATHTIMVAPEGVGLRFVPFSLNVPVGDTVRYIWTTPANHTVTLSSALAPCNKSGIADQRNFSSGVRNAKDGQQTFDVVVQTDKPQFFYCSVQQHCNKGMFGILNPPTFGSVSVASIYDTVPTLGAGNEFLSNEISSSKVSQWGADISLDGISPEYHQAVAENVLFTRAAMHASVGQVERREEGAEDAKLRLFSRLTSILSRGGLEDSVH